MEINQKASEILKELCADIDFNKAGYRPPLKEPLILARLDDETMKSLEILGYKLESNELKVSTQKQLFHGMRLKKIADGRALSKADFIGIPLHINNDNLYVGLNEYRKKEIRFFWDIDIRKDKAKYIYFNLNCELGTYGITNINTIKSAIKVER